MAQGGRRLQKDFKAIPPSTVQTKTDLYGLNSKKPNAAHHRKSIIPTLNHGGASIMAFLFSGVWAVKQD